MNKILIFLVIAAFTGCLAHVRESAITRALKEFKVIPDVITEDVPETLSVIFNSGALVNKGNIIMPTQARDEPVLDWNADPNALYTVVCTDPDAPSPTNPFLGELNTWTVVNIPGKNVAAGDVLFAYIGSAPPRGADLNRYVFLVYKQPQRILYDETPVDKYSIQGRANFPVGNFANKYQLGAPVAANFYRSKFDNYALELYAQLQCCFEYNQPE